MSEYERLFGQLRAIDAWGVKIYMCGEAASPEHVASELAQKAGRYKPRFVYDADGSLFEVYYNLVV